MYNANHCIKHVIGNDNIKAWAPVTLIITGHELLVLKIPSKIT